MTNDTPPIGVLNNQIELALTIISFFFNIFVSLKMNGIHRYIKGMTKNDSLKLLIRSMWGTQFFLFYQVLRKYVRYEIQRAKIPEAEIGIYFVYCTFFYIACWLNTIQFLQFMNQLLKEYTSINKQFTIMPCLLKNRPGSKGWELTQKIYAILWFDVHILDQMLFIATHNSTTAANQTNSQALDASISILNTTVDVIIMIDHIFMMITVFSFKKHTKKMPSRMATLLIFYGIVHAGITTLRNAYCMILEFSNVGGVASLYKTMIAYDEYFFLTQQFLQGILGMQIASLFKKSIKKMGVGIVKPGLI